MKAISKIKKFMFVVPNTRWFGKRCWLWFVPGVTILSQMLKKNGYDVKICEANIDNLSSEEVKKKIKSYGPDVVGISNMSIEYWSQLHLCAELAKEADKNIIVIAGGVHPITLPEKVMEDSNVDYVVLSEGEERLFQLLDIIQSDYDFTRMNGVLYRENGVVKKIPSHGWYRDLNNVTIPDLEYQQHLIESYYDKPLIPW